MAKVHVYVNQDLKARMGKVQESISWSNVACDAFEMELVRRGAWKPSKETIDEKMNDLRNRMHQLEMWAGLQTAK